MGNALSLKGWMTGGVGGKSLTLAIISNHFYPMQPKCAPVVAYPLAFMAKLYPLICDPHPLTYILAEILLPSSDMAHLRRGYEKTFL